MEKDLAKQVVFASQGLSFFVGCMDTAVFSSTAHYTTKPHEVQIQTGFPLGHLPAPELAVFLFTVLTKASVSAIIRSVRIYHLLTEIVSVFRQISQEAGNGKEKEKTTE